MAMENTLIQCYEAIPLHGAFRKQVFCQISTTPVSDVMTWSSHHGSISCHKGQPWSQHFQERFLKRRCSREATVWSWSWTYILNILLERTLKSNRALCQRQQTQCWVTACFRRLANGFSYNGSHNHQHHQICPGFRKRKSTVGSIMARWNLARTSGFYILGSHVDSSQ